MIHTLARLMLYAYLVGFLLLGSYLIGQIVHLVHILAP